MHAFIIHGAYGNPDENWFPWLAKALEQLGYTVMSPHFPTPENQTLGNWLALFKPYLSLFEEDTIVIGHSLGPAFLMSVLEQVTKPIRAAYFIAGFTGKLGNPDFDTINDSFVNKSFDWTTIKNNCKHFTLFHADNDPYVPLAKAQALATKLDTTVTIVNGAGHFNTAAGYTTFPQLLEAIKKN